MIDFWIRQNDSAPSIAATLRDSDDKAIDLTAATVRFHMRPRGAAPAVEAEATIVDAAAGKVRYDWSAGDTAIAGRHEAEWEISHADGTVQTVPNDSSIQIQITREIA